MTLAVKCALSAYVSDNMRERMCNMQSGGWIVTVLAVIKTHCMQLDVTES